MTRQTIMVALGVRVPKDTQVMPTVRTSEEGRALVARRHSVESYARSIARRAPDLSDQQIRRLRGILRPALERAENGEATST